MATTVDQTAAMISSYSFYIFMATLCLVSGVIGLWKYQAAQRAYRKSFDRDVELTDHEAQYSDVNGQIPQHYPMTTQDLMEFLGRPSPPECELAKPSPCHKQDHVNRQFR
ncbi:hypothetical protein HIM_00961 [Hirsutella minnesotensis 3608]|nr:hypothetical protein HIM_00961 [Hirsutella minnesotensis 3608]